MRVLADGAVEVSVVPDITRFAGYATPRALAKDTLLTRDERIGGLRTWRAVVVRSGRMDSPRGESYALLLDEIERALKGLLTR